jgi:calcineurin-like phosphoesterase family protein
MYFWTADEHYGHTNIIGYANRPFATLAEMESVLIANFNERVTKSDTVIHVGDFCMQNKEYANNIIRQLNGTHCFLDGDHDRWLPRKGNYYQIWYKRIDGQQIVASHWSMRTWKASHYNSWNLYGHSHGRLEPVGKQWDVGVDYNHFYPVSFIELQVIMKNRPDNFNYLNRNKDYKC